MKGTKLLTSIAALALVVGLGGCGTKDDFEVVSGDWSEALSLIGERGEAFGSWTGLEGSWDTQVEYYLDMTAYGGEADWFDYLDSYTDLLIEKAVVDEEGVLTGFFEETTSYYDGDLVYGEYIEGDDYWLNYYGTVIPVAGGAEGIGLDYFTEDISYLLIDEESGLVPTFELYGVYIELGLFGDGWLMSGTIEEAPSGRQRATVRIEYDTAGTYTGYGAYTEVGYMEVAVEYDAEGEISLFTYTYDDTTDWNEGEEVDIVKQVISYAPFDGEVERPAWVED
ncbi:MAG: hypothetical protein LUD22_00085 [Coprobacillus sp.]|nr:hypothetical protein [Coprobacillus sp.]